MQKILTPFILFLLSFYSFSAFADMHRDRRQTSGLSANQHDTQKKIMAHFYLWEGVRYKLGGNTRQGIDCSAYMQRIFNDEFSFSLPRTTHEQVKQGSRINKSDLTTGDLVFFKTSPQERHVGVYIGEGKFIHASSRAGVTVSMLENQYWQVRYEQARRIHYGA
ncbi:NlpC/P60 family protein [Serratia fonticola]|uniref:NlpC/P60 family protein n=1 Tax=Serratia fonticola TaxID=47917 RepID=UPI000E0EEE36|nr:NlpC/P60 family protein [Serratia fonticola]